MIVHLMSCKCIPGMHNKIAIYWVFELKGQFYLPKLALKLKSFLLFRGSYE